MDIPEASIRLEYTIDQDNDDNDSKYDDEKEIWLTGFDLTVFASSDEKKIKVSDLIKSASFLKNLNEEWMKDEDLFDVWSDGFTGLEKASDPVTKKVEGKRVCLIS